MLNEQSKEVGPAVWRRRTTILHYGIEDTSKRFSWQGITPMVEVDHCDPSIRMEVNTPASLSGPAKGKPVLLSRPNQLVDRKISKEVNAARAPGHTTTASAGFSMMSPLGGGSGTGRSDSRRVVIYASMASCRARTASCLVWP